MINNKDIERAYDKFIRVGFAGISLLRRELKYTEYKARRVMDFMVAKGVIEAFDGNVTQKIIITDRKEAAKCLGL